MPTAAVTRTREPRAAARSARFILLVCSGVVTAFTVVQHSSAGTTTLVSWLGVGLLAAAAVTCALVPADRLDRTGALVALPCGGVLLVCLLNLVTQDASTAAQAFLAFPVLWAASHLRQVAVVLVTAAAVTALGVTLTTLRPLEAAVTDVVFFGTVLVVMALLLVRAREVQDRLVAALEQQAAVDALTGLVNRRVFDTALERTLTRPADAGTALVLVDVDSFKSINDTYGHPVGDDVLVHLSGILRRSVRTDDGLLSRLGGDELAVLLPGSPADAAARRAEELLEAVRSTPLPLPDGTLLSLSVSVGVAHVAAGSADLRALYSAADGALYEAKRAGRGRVGVAAG
ncbi:diguanylate cyclase [Geodermatophilus sp. URMC 60]